MGKIMVQGTASGVGKSIISAGLCRIFSQDGYKVIPFKSQNMSSNIYIDEDGKKMGVGQAVQAENCGVKPKAYMNPILLRPAGNHNIEVFVRGESIGVMSSDEFSNYKDELIFILEEIYRDIEKKSDIVVIEGAGSPVELNLDSVDLSNMKMAEISDSKVILVADIDKGGVFASIVGTLELLKPEERKRIAGIIVNKLRGKKEKFDSGVDIIEKLTGVPVLGVVPYIELDIDEEDSVGEANKKNKSNGEKIKVEKIIVEEISSKEINRKEINRKEISDKKIEDNTKKSSYTDEGLSNNTDEYDKLAEHLRKNLDMDLIYEIVF